MLLGGVCEGVRGVDREMERVGGERGGGERGGGERRGREEGDFLSYLPVTSWLSSRLRSCSSLSTRVRVRGRGGNGSQHT